MRLLTVTLSLAALAVSSGSEAQVNRAAARADCRSDFQRLCSRISPGGGRIANCLRNNLEKLSAKCRAHVETAGRPEREASQPPAETGAK